MTRVDGGFAVLTLRSGEAPLIRVVRDGKPAANVTVVAYPKDYFKYPVYYEAKTGADGVAAQWYAKSPIEIMGWELISSIQSLLNWAGPLPADRAPYLFFAYDEENGYAWKDNVAEFPLTLQLKAAKEPPTFYISFEVSEPIVAEVAKAINDSFLQYIDTYVLPIDIVKTEVRNRTLIVYFKPKTASPAIQFVAAAKWVAVCIVLLIALVVVLRWAFGEGAPVVAALGLGILLIVLLLLLAPRRREKE